MPPEYTVHCKDIPITVLSNVYAPQFFTDSFWFAEQLPKIVRQSSLLEIGCGTGIISLSCARNGARVVATDINPDAVINSRVNVTKNSVGVEVREGGIYEPLSPNERFDFIFWAHPFNNWPTPVADMLMRSGLDHDYNDLREYISKARDHLTTNGRLLLGSGDSADLATIHAIAADNDYSLHILKHIDMPLEEGGNDQIRYLLIEFVHS